MRRRDASSRPPTRTYVADRRERGRRRGAKRSSALDTVVLDLRGLVDSFDALVLTSGRNDRQVRALAEEVERLVGLALDVEADPRRGTRAKREWVALDYGDVIVHVFDEAAREYYDLEHLWSAAPAFGPSPRAATQIPR